jgi:hypothetical protein
MTGLASEAARPEAGGSWDRRGAVIKMPAALRSTDGGATWQATEPTYYGGAYKTVGILADNVFVGSYSESGEGSGSEFSRPTIVLGGKHAAGFGPLTSASLITNITGS